MNITSPGGGEGLRIVSGTSGDDSSGDDHELSRAGVQIHPSSVVEDSAIIGPGTRIWHHSHVRGGSCIGSECTIGHAVYIDSGAVIGDRCKIQNGSSVYLGCVLEDDVFVGPHVAFTNDPYPRADATHWALGPTTVREGASIGANATIVCPVEVGAWATVAAGSVVVSDVPPHGLVMGSPARLVGWVCRCGRPLVQLDEPVPSHCDTCGRRSSDTPIP